MRVHISDLDQDKTITLSGTEDWLTTLYANFPLGETGAGVKPRLTGSLKLTLAEGGYVHVRGSLKYAPILNCGRCEKGLPLPLDLAIDTTYMPAAAPVADKELNLTEADLETYYLEDDAVDLEGLIIDTVDLAVPTRFVVTKDDDKTCAACGIDLSNDRLYASHGDEAAEKASPFSILKDLKLH